MKRFVLVAAAVAVATLAGCSNTSTTATSPSTNASASSGGDTTPKTTPGTTKTTGTTKGTTPGASSAFCSRVRTLDELSKSSGAKAGDVAAIKAFVKGLDELEAEAPADLRESIRTLAAAFVKLETLGGGEADLDKAFEIIMDPKVVKAGTAIEEAAKTQCGIDLNIMGGSSSTSSGTTPKGTVPPGGGSATGAGYDCSKITSSFESQQTDPTSIYNVKKAMCTSNPSGSWGKAVFSSAAWSSSGADPATWEVVVYTDFDPPPNLSVDDAVNVCTAMATYLSSVGSGASEISIATGSSGGGTSDSSKTVLARKSASGSCQPA